MNNIPPPTKDGQAPARRFGALVAIVVILLFCVCAVGGWALFNKDSIEILKTSFHLQSNGVKTDGTIVALEKHSSPRPGSGPVFKFIVEYDVDGETYTLKSLTAYGALDTHEVGDTIPVIYDPEDPTIAQIDTFTERWIFLLDFIPF
jgi:hypothetical protein